MDTERADVKEIFCAAIEKKTAAERSSYLDKACGGDKKLRGEVEALLKAHYEANNRFLESPPGVDVTLDLPLAEGPGTRIGRYKLLEMIGEGGFGVVYMAQQEEPIRRRVALKIIKLGMDTKQVIARFEAERQALAMMEHPNIAKVLEAGATDTGRPYFVMELVKGIPITEYCDKNNLETRQRLELFINVCRAIQHAHQKGIIHRDIKPTNVMITLRDDDTPVPKIIDFGIAKATQQKLTEKTYFTEFKQFIGTPEYMSPEQARMGEMDVDTRTDIYSLGVLLYELLTGTTPFDGEKLRSSAYDEMLKTIRETEPAKPSTRLNTLGDALGDVAKHRQVEPGQLCKIIQGDLDWIVLKTLEKNRGRRYETANELVADIRRHLSDEPVVAGPPGVSYRLGKFVRRNRTGVVFGLLVTAALVVGLALAMAGFIQASHQRNRAVLARTEAVHQRQRAEDNFQKAREAVDQMLTQVAEELPRLPGMPERLDPPQVAQIKQALLEDALEYYEGFLEERSSDPLVRYETAHAYLRVGDITKLMRQHERAEETYGAAASLLEELSGEFPAEPDYRMDLARTYRGQADLLRDAGRAEEAKAAYRQSIKTHKKLLDDFPDVARYADDLVANQFGWAMRLDWEGAELEALQEHRYCLVLVQRLIDDFSGDPRFQNWLGQSGHWLGHRLDQLGELPESAEAYRLAVDTFAKLANEFPTQSRYKVNCGHAYTHLGWRLVGFGEFQEAEQVHRRGVGVLEEVEADSPIADSSHDNSRYLLTWAYESLGALLVGTGRLVGGEEFLAKALALAREGVDEFPQPHLFRNVLGSVNIRRGDMFRITGQFQEAEQAYREALGILLKLVEDFPETPLFRIYLSSSYYRLGLLLTDMERLQDAKDSFHRVQTIREKLAEEFPAIPAHWNRLAWALATCPDTEFNDPQRAVDLAQKAVELAPNSENYWRTLGVAHYRAGDWEGAIAAFTKRMEVGPGARSLDWFYLAMAYWQLGKEDEASRWYEQAVEWMENNKLLNIELRRLKAEAESLIKPEEVEKEAE